MKVWKKLKSLNWTVYFVVICMSLAGAAQNKNVHSLKDALILGTVGGIILGLPFALIGRYEE